VYGAPHQVSDDEVPIPCLKVTSPPPPSDSDLLLLLRMLPCLPTVVEG
jgi:hypothetical protein